MGILKKGDKRWKDMNYLARKAQEWKKSGKNVPTNLPQDFELKDADGKVTVRLMRGKPVEVVGEPKGSETTAASNIDKALKDMGHVSWTPPAVEFTPPSKTAPVGVGPGVPGTTVINKALFQAIGTGENMIAKPPPESAIDTSDKTCEDLATVFAVAYPGVVVSPKISFWVIVGTWQFKFWIWVVMEKGKSIREWFGGLFGKKKGRSESIQGHEKEAKA